VLASAQHALSRAAEAAQGRLLAFRVRIQGATRLDAALRASRDRVVEELCSLSYAVGGAGAWLEKLVLTTEPQGGRIVIGDDALAEIERALGGLLAEDGAALAEQFADLAKKLPAEVLELVPELRAPTVELLAELGRDVTGLLRERLAVGHDAP
jgi:hypothetical protein